MRARNPESINTVNQFIPHASSLGVAFSEDGNLNTKHADTICKSLWVAPKQHKRMAAPIKKEHSMNINNLCQAQKFCIHVGALHGMTNTHDIENLNHVKAIATQFTDSIGTKTPELKLLSYLNPREEDPQKVAIVFDDGSLVRIRHSLTCEMVQRVFGISEEIDLFWLPAELVTPASLGGEV